VYNYQGIRYIVKEDKYHVFDRKLVQETLKIFENVNYKGNVEEVDVNLSTIALKENYLEKFIDTFTEALQSACRKTFKTISTENQTKKKKSVPWWTEGLTIMWKRLNALRRIYQRTRNNEELRECRKRKYFEEKKKYQTEIRKEKLNSWKEYCNVTASSNPWSQVYKLATGKARTNSIMTTLRKPNGTETSSLQETMNVMLDNIIAEDKEEEETYHHNSVRKMTEEPIHTSDDTEFTQAEIKQTIEIFNGKKAPGIDGIKSGLFLRTFNKFPRQITAIYNQCLKTGCFSGRGKTAKIIPITKSGKENSTDLSKYRPISLLNIRGKVIEELLINRINHNMYKNELLTDRQYGFMPQKSTTDAAMEAKKKTELVKRKVVIMTSLDVKGTFDAVWWPSILKGLKNSGCPRNLYNLSKGYFSHRSAVMSTNSVSIERSVT
jgi:hypothetical protein